MTVTDTPFVHTFELDPALIALFEQEGVDINEIAEIVESAPGADLVTPRSPSVLLIEQYVLMLSDSDLSENVQAKLDKFKSWLTKFSYFPKF